MLKKEKLKKLFTEVIKNVLKKLSINMVHLADFMVDRKKWIYWKSTQKKIQKIKTVGVQFRGRST